MYATNVVDIDNFGEFNDCVASNSGGFDRILFVPRVLFGDFIYYYRLLRAEAAKHKNITTQHADDSKK